MTTKRIIKILENALELITEDDYICRLIYDNCLKEQEQYLFIRTDNDEFIDLAKLQKHFGIHKYKPLGVSLAWFPFTDSGYDSRKSILRKTIADWKATLNKKKHK